MGINLMLLSRPSHEEHRPRAPAPRVFRILVRLAESTAPSTTSVGEDYIPGHVDQHLLLSPVGYTGRDGRRARGGGTGCTTSGSEEVEPRVRNQGQASAVGQIRVSDADPLQGAERWEMGRA